MSAESSRHGRASSSRLRLAGLLLAGLLGLASSASPAGTVPQVLARPAHVLRGGMLGPTDVAVGPDDRVYVLDGVHQRVLVFDRDGRRVASVGGLGGEDSMATGLDVSSSGRIYVADPALHRVRVLSADHGVVATWSLPSGPGGPADPTDVVLAEELGRAYVLDNDNHRVLVLDLASGRVLQTVGSQGQGRGQYRYPFLGDFDPARREVMVVEVLNTRVQVLGEAGSTTRTFGAFGVNAGQLFRPKGVVVDGNSRAWVSDGYLGVVQAFGPDGRFIGALADANTGRVVKLVTPTGVAIDSRGRLYVVQAMSNDVRAYDLPGGAP